MRLLFAHDHRFYRGSDGFHYSGGAFSADAWDRYLRHFDEVEVVARDGGTMSDDGKFSLSSAPGVKFTLLPNLSSVRQLLLPSAEVEARMRAAVDAAGAVVARLPSEIGFLAVACARRLGKPYAVEVVACAWGSYRSNGARAARLYAPLAYMRSRRTIAESPLALYVTSSWLQRRYPTRGYAQSASNVFAAPLDEEAREARLSRLASLRAGERPVLGTIGSLRVKYKGIQTAFEALAQLRSVGLDLTYRILGSGDPEPWRRLAGDLEVLDLVHFDGTRTVGKGVHRWLDEIDIYLQPSFTEGLPRAMIEAMSRGAACIGSTCGGIPELLPRHRMHAPRDADALAEIIATLVRDPQKIEAASREDLDASQQFAPAILDARRDDVFGRLRAQAK